MKYIAISLFIVLIIFLAGCTGSAKQYSSSKAKEITSDINEVETDEEIVKRYDNLIGESFKTENLEITIKGFDITYDDATGVSTAHILFLAENVGKEEESIFCSRFMIIDDRKREFELEHQYLDLYFGKGDNYGGIQPGLSMIIECTQVFPSSANLTTLKYESGLFDPIISKINITDN